MASKVKMEAAQSVNATADERTLNTLILIGTGDEISLAEQMIIQLDTPDSAPRGAPSGRASRQ